MDARHRNAIEDAVARALEDGATAEEIREEVEYAIENYEEEA